MRRHFLKTDFRLLSGSFLVIDIDGTLVCDGSETIGAETVHAVRMLAKKNTACIVSNKKDTARNVRVAHTAALPYVHGKKPYKRLVSALRRMNGAGLPFVVIGDRYLTDGLLALRLGGEFVPVRPLRADKEPLRLRIAYAFHESVTALALAVIPFFRKP